MLVVVLHTLPLDHGKAPDLYAQEFGAAKKNVCCFALGLLFFSGDLGSSLPGPFYSGSPNSLLCYMYDIFLINMFLKTCFKRLYIGHSIHHPNYINYVTHYESGPLCPKKPHLQPKPAHSLPAQPGTATDMLECETGKLCKLFWD